MQLSSMHKALSSIPSTSHNSHTNNNNKNQNPTKKLVSTFKWQLSKFYII